MAAVATSLLAAAGARLWSCDFPQMPTLLQNLPSGEEKMSERLRSRFPIGSSETELIHELWLEGFRPITDLRAPRREAEFDRLGDVIHDICRRHAAVYWSADDIGRLTAVSGNFFIDCP